METFGLMQLLNALLPKGEQKEEPTSPPEAEKAPSLPPEREKPNACAQFFERHDHRAKNLPKR